MPGFGDPAARVLMVGLAPPRTAATARARLHRRPIGRLPVRGAPSGGLANQPTSHSVTDGLRLTDLYLTAVNRCAPPANQPTPEERDACLPYLAREMAALTELRVIVALGAFAWDGVLRALAGLGHRVAPGPGSGMAPKPGSGRTR